MIKKIRLTIAVFLINVAYKIMPETEGVIDTDVDILHTDETEDLFVEEEIVKGYGRY